MSIVVTRPDKGRGVVVLDHSAYVEKMETVVADDSKFSVVKEPVLKTIRQVTNVEDKINGLLSKLKALGMMTDALYKRLFVTGSTLGALY